MSNSNSTKSQTQLDFHRRSAPPEIQNGSTILNFQPELDELWDLWSFDKRLTKDTINSLVTQFRKEVCRQLNTFKPSHINSDIRMHFELVKFMNSNKGRPFIGDGQLGEWFTTQLQNNLIPNSIVKRWFRNLDYLKEYKEFVFVYGRSPHIKTVYDVDGVIGVKNGGVFGNYERKLAHWADDVRYCDSQGRLLESKKRQILDELGDEFSWDFVVDTSETRRGKRFKR